MAGTLVAIVSPYNSDTEEGRRANLDYARAAAHDCLHRGEIPLALHLVLGDPSVPETPEIRALALAGSFHLINAVDKVVIYLDRGISEGMRIEMYTAVHADKPVEHRIIDKSNEGVSLQELLSRSV